MSINKNVSKRQVFVSYVPQSVNKSQFYDFVKESLGDVDFKVDLFRAGKWKKGKITFDDEDNAERALALNGTMIPSADIESKIKVIRKRDAESDNRDDKDTVRGGRGRGGDKRGRGGKQRSRFEDSDNTPKRGNRGPRGGASAGRDGRSDSEINTNNSNQKKSKYRIAQKETTEREEDNTNKYNQKKHSGNSKKGQNDNGGRKRKEKKFFKCEHWDLEDVEKGIEAENVFVGEFLVSGSDRKKAYVKVPGREFDIAIEGLNHQNRALHGDTVAVKINPKGNWRKITLEQAARIRNFVEDPENVTEDPLTTDASNEETTEDSSVESVDSDDSDEEIILESDSKDDDDKPEEKISVPTGYIVRIMERQKDLRIIGTLFPLYSDEEINENWVSFRPESNRLPIFYIRPRQCPKDYLENPEKYASTLFEISFTAWGISNHKPTGKIEGELGISGDIVAESNIIVRKYDLPDGELGDEYVSEYGDEVVIDPEELKKRRDLRTWRIFSIDPKTARDLDDALSCVKLEDGNYEVGVHIADVSHYVKRGSELDFEARKRGTSVYLVQRVISMLPRKLSQNLCSLNENVDRYAFSVVWKLSPDGEVLSEWIGKSVIRTCVRLAYEDAQLLLDDLDAGEKNLISLNPSAAVEDIKNDLLSLFEISFKLRSARFENGSVSMNSPQFQFELDEDKNPLSFHPHEHKEANKLVEEFMLLANRRIAGFCLKHFPAMSVLRNHNEPDQEKMNKILNLCEKIGVEIDTSSSYELNRSLELIPDLYPQIPYLKEFLEESLTFPMRPAEYICTGDTRVQSYHHYALNFEHYTHFTSPIRRYPDLLVHRIVQAALEGNTDPVGELEDVVEALRISNMGKSKAQKAQRESEKCYLGVFFKNNPEIRPDCIITELGSKFLKVFVAGYAISELMMRFDEDMKTEYNTDSETVTVTWGDEVFTHRREYKLLDLITIKIQLRRRPDGTPVRPLELEGVLFKEKIDYRLFKNSEDLQHKKMMSQ